MSREQLRRFLPYSSCMMYRRTSSYVVVTVLTMACRGPDVRPMDTGVAGSSVAVQGGDTAFTPGDTVVLASASGPSELSTANDSSRPLASLPRGATPKKSPAAPAAPAASATRTAVPVPVVAPDTQPSVIRVTAPVDSTAPTPPAKIREPEPRVVSDTLVPPAPLPFSPGERLEYQVKFGSISVGKAVLEVVGIDTVRGIPAMHIRLRVEGKMGFLGVKDRYESWVDTRTMSSLRYIQDIDQATYERERHYEIYPDRQTYHEKGKKERPSVAAPLDDASFLFFLRSIPLALGETYSFDRYFKPDRNPVRVAVLRKEKVRVPAGTFSTVVVRPIIKTTGLFSEGGKAEVWFTDDDSRLVVQLKTQMKIGSLNLFLRKVQRAPAP